MKKLFLLSIFILFLTSCYYDRFEELHPMIGYQDPCDSTLSDTYTGSVSLILTVNCISCHSGSYKAAGVDLSNYNSTKSLAASGKLMGTIKQLPGYKPMPPNSKIPACQINKLQNWIDNGMPQ